MTLAVSLRVPDGVIIAADSLSTIVGHIGVLAKVETTCPECKKKIKLDDIKSPPIPIPSSTSSFAQKVFPFNKIFGIAAYGMAILNEKTIYYHTKMIENGLKSEKSGVTEISKILLEYFDKEIRKQTKDIDQAPDGFSPLGLLVAGYDDNKGKTILVHIGKNSYLEEKTGSGCTIGGDTEVVTKLWELSKSNPQRATTYGSFSLQDAADYAEYLIHATANFQRFANMIPTVGGEVDIGLITPFRRFTWIKCKELSTKLEKEYI